MGFFNAPFYIIVGGIMGHLGGTSYFIYNYLFKKNFLRSINYDPSDILVSFTLFGGSLMYALGYFTNSIETDKNED
tara:strand:+ start:123 stop:350 length:228 start_codon:yes stop_codon:yes gene_type:complete